jgi:hypothetical protein
MKNLIKSLSDFQNECPIIHKDTKGHNYTYADLPQIFSVINPLLKKHKLCFTQLLENDGIKTILFHVESGEQLQSFTQIPKVKLGNMNDYQAYGSGVTYFRRYALSSMLGIITDKDTDAAGTQVKESVQAKPKIDDVIIASSINATSSIEKLNAYYKQVSSDYELTPEQIKLFSNRKSFLK